ncbi:invasion associated locus B family protein [Marinimicrococcus flavescens]|uniref:Invasion associated locus B family protein n=1 Tax=Marinimicrococcus flavescens TaxID=3031815 RepID=A0AAP3UXP2_9PROT|nr:invasion associated locus B family protein [Marinimicrococcus flavescens]
MTRFIGTALVAIALGAGLAAPARAQETPAAPAQSERIGDWTVLCRGADAARRCMMAQELGAAGSQKSSVAWTIRLDGEGRVVGTIRTPQGVLLPAGVSAAVDGGQALRIPYRTCVPAGCVAPFLITDELAAAMKAGKQTRVLFRDVRDRQFDSRFSLQGFTKAFGKLQESAGAR